MSNSNVDILVLGATGYSGGLIVKYLTHHPLRKRFSLGIAGRSATKLKELKDKLDLSANVPTFTFNISAYEEVNRTVQRGKVIINCIGPYWRVSTPIVQACAGNGVHYVDLSGESWWIKDLIERLDYQASKNKAVIIPACGHDSAPSDLAVYLSARTANKKLGPNIELGPSLTGITFSSAASGGTLATVLSIYDSLPRHRLEGVHDSYMLAPVKGAERPFQLVYSLPFTKLHGGISIMGAINKKIVNRTWGLLEARARSSGSKPVEPIRYGPHFSYDEFSVQGSRLAGAMFTFMFMISMALVAFCPPLRWLLKTFGPQPGTGPKETEKQFVRYTNVTTTYAPRSNRRSIKTTLLFRGGVYTSSSVLCSEAALTILLHHTKLPSLGQEGGVLTPITALGEPYLQRLLDSGFVTYDSEVVGNGRATQ